MTLGPPSAGGRTNRTPRASATPNTRPSPRALATPSPRPSPRASRNPGPPRTLALGGTQPGHHESPIRGAPAGPDTGHHYCAWQEFFLCSLSTDSSRVAMRFAVRVAVRSRVVRAWFVAFLAIVSIGTALGTCSNTCESVFDSNRCTCNDRTYKKSNGGCSCIYGVCSKTKYSCYSCDSSCRKCDGGGSSDCTACDDFKYLSSGQCKSCHSDCATCYSSGSDECYSCRSSATPHVKYKPGEIYGHFDYGTCVECTDNNHCTVYPRNVCSSSNTCVQCVGNSDCPSGTYCSGNTCQNCDPTCATCYVGGSDNCKSCNDGRYGDFNSYGECRLCHSTCATCDRKSPPLYGQGSKCDTCKDTSKIVSGDECVECTDNNHCTHLGQGYKCGGSGTCDPDPCVVVAPDNGGLGDCPASLPSGSSCSPTCASGYTRNGVTSCLAGTLTSVVTCGADPCDVSTLPANAVDPGDCTATLSSGSSCEPTCVLGYVASAARCFAGNLTAAACDREPSCDASALPAGASDLGDCNATLPSRSSCSPTCDDGYTLTAASECVAGTLTPATCEETPTPPPPPLTPPPPARPSLVFEDDESRAKRAGAHTASAFACATVAAVLAA